MRPRKRPPYINKLRRKQCSIIVKTRCQVLPLKVNQRSNHTELTCRLCGAKEETQEHILEKCPEIAEELKLKYIDIFEEQDPTKLAIYADRIQEIMDKIDIASSDRNSRNRTNA